ncbi:MAG: 16S rRNA methyltransferase [Ardenticatenaceae bacterium]|nr:16S rRNA methyltransferase [Ardenticatenaceae bacterium]
MSVDTLAQTILATSKYRHISPDLVRRIGERELAVRRSTKEAIKATKNKLHQVGGAYFEAKVDYQASLKLLRESNDRLAACRQLMQLHASTRERLPILDDFYRTIFAQLPPMQRVIDIACGLNPLAYPWMLLLPDAEYLACDIYGDMIEFLNGFMALSGIKGQAAVRDVIGRPPTIPADLILILKTLPCLEQVDKTAAATLLDQLNGRYLLITYPAQSLGGRRKGMIANYTDHFYSLANGRNWQVTQFEFETELAFLVETEN